MSEQRPAPSRCSHGGKLLHAEYDLDELMGGVEDGDTVFVTGFCELCGASVDRELRPVTRLTDEWKELTREERRENNYYD